MADKRQQKTQTRKSRTITLNHDVIIVGAGLAGLFAALKLAPIPTTIIAAKTLGSGSSSVWAQGGVAAAIGEGDTTDKHAADTINVGAGIVDHQIAQLITSEAPAAIKDLLHYGVPFDKNIEGKLQLSKEAAHSNRRIVRVEGDRAGAAIMAALISAVKQTPSIQILEQIEVHKLARKNGHIKGVYFWPSSAKGTGKGTLLKARSVILATGGCGHLFEKTTNPDMARGEGLAMAAKIGAVISDAEFVQFHPTAIDSDIDPAPLATEALRGEGAHLINNQGERFMQQLHKDAELAPRDIVAIAVDRERKAGRGAFLDCASTIGKNMEQQFPTVIQKCREIGIDPTKDPIPVAPAAHFHMGGIVTDANGRSTIDGLWACGEVASTGLHGANRLASNSLLEAVVMSSRIASDIKNNATRLKQGRTTVKSFKEKIIDKQLDTDLKSAVSSLRQIIFQHVGVERSEKSLRLAIEQLEKLEPILQKSARTKNMLLTAKFIVKAAYDRKESRGSHLRTDHPEKVEPATRSYLKLKDIDNFFSTTR